ncbi:MAG: hypothetical protein WDZ91_06245 [Paenibacillaceae bacterium]
MSKFKTSIYGFHKPSVKEHLKKLQAEHELKKQTLENELMSIKTQLEKLK